MGRERVERWSIRKTVARGENGIVASQHYVAAQAGAVVLEKGGNAVDAAVTAGFLDQGLVDHGPGRVRVVDAEHLDGFAIVAEQVEKVAHRPRGEAFGADEGAIIPLGPVIRLQGFEEPLLVWGSVCQRRSSSWDPAAGRIGISLDALCAAAAAPPCIRSARKET